MIKPDYKNSTVNLMSSIGKVVGWKSKYSSIKELDEKIKDAEKILLIAVDGMGYKYLMSRKKSFLKDNLMKRITTVFPSTTAAAITVFLTGLPPQQTAMTGWFMKLKEYDCVAIPFTFESRIGNIPLEKKGISIKQVFNFKSFYDQLKYQSKIISPKKIIDSKFNEVANGSAEVFAYTGEWSFARKIKKALKKEDKKIIYAYWSKLDTSMHKTGVKSKKSEKTFRKIDKTIRKICRKNKNVKVIVTADHGLLDTPFSKRINLNDYKKIINLLSDPVAGDPRQVHFYIKKGKKKEFEKYAKKYFNEKAYIMKRNEIIKKGFFGKYKANPKLKERVGDYVLIMKKNYILHDSLKDENFGFVGVHGGMTEEEMYVPLIFIET